MARHVQGQRGLEAVSEELVRAVRDGVATAKQCLRDRGVAHPIMVSVRRQVSEPGLAGTYSRLSQFRPGGARIDVFAPSLCFAVPYLQFVDVEATITVVHEYGHLMAEWIRLRAMYDQEVRALNEELSQHFPDEEDFAEQLAQHWVGAGVYPATDSILTSYIRLGGGAERRWSPTDEPAPPFY